MDKATKDGCTDNSGTRTAVLVLNYNGSRFLDACLQALQRNSRQDFAIYMIDNGSTDDSTAVTRSRYPTVRVVEYGENLGYAKAYDRAIRDLDYDLFVLLNNDTVVDRDWFGNLLKAMKNDNRIAACGPKILSARDGKTVDHAGGMLTMIGAGLDIGKQTMDRGQYEVGCEIGFVCGCSLMITRDAYIRVGGFDPDYFMYHEDVDLCWRLRLAGYSVRYVPDAIVYHHGGGGDSGDAFKVFHCQKNRLANVLKNRESGGMIFSLLVSVVFDAVRFIQFTLNKREDLLCAVLRGYADTIRNFKALLRKRRAVQRNRVCSDRELQSAFASLLSSMRDYSRISRE